MLQKPMETDADLDGTVLGADDVVLRAPLVRSIARILGSSIYVSTLTHDCSRSSVCQQPRTQ